MKKTDVSIPAKKTSRPVYLLLLCGYAVAFILHGNNENYGLIPSAVLAVLLLKYVLITLGIAAFSLVLFKDTARATVLSFVLLVIYFLFGAVKDFFTQHADLSVLAKYSVLLPLIFLIICLIVYLMKKNRMNVSKAAGMITFFLLVNLTVEAGWCVYNVFTRADLKQDYGDREHILINSYTSSPAARKPDVFWLVFDEYAASSSLKKVWNYTNPLDAVLQSKGFFVAAKASSNYNYTPYSITSILDMTYLKGLGPHSIVTARDMARGIYSVYDNNVVQVFEKTGYQIVNYSIFNTRNHPAKGLDPFGYVPGALVDLQTLGGRTAHDIGWNFSNLFAADRKRAMELDEQHTMQSFDRDYDALLTRCHQEIRTGANEPQPLFAMFHFMVPHEPFIYNPDGSLAYDKGLNASKEGYIRQLQYTNSVINAITDSILASYHQKEVVIIVQGDHGYKFDERDPFFEAESCKTLYAVYCTDQAYGAWKNELTVVNSFRILFNKYFGAQFPMLSDTSFNLYYR